jgi:hypothetical protein
MVLSYMKDVDRPVTSNEVAVATGLSIKSVYNVLYRLRNEVGTARIAGKDPSGTHNLYALKPVKEAPKSEDVPAKKVVAVEKPSLLDAALAAGKAKKTDRGYTVEKPATKNGAAIGDLFEIVGFNKDNVAMVRSLDSSRVFWVQPI